MACEDYPACGHESTQECHDAATAPEGYWPLRCVECGGRIKLGDEYPDVPSMHERCGYKLSDHDDYYDEDD